MMFGFGKKESYEDRIRAALAENLQSKAASIAREAFANDKEEEHVLAWIASSIYERKIASAFDLLEEFMVRFPNSLHLPRVYLADILSRASRFDQASDLSRHYLRLAHEAGVLPELASKRIIQEGVSRSFLLLTSAYTTLGARSYSRRVLQFGLGFGLAERWRGVIENELHQLGNELQQADFADEDSKWECFFRTGAGLDDLYKKCIDGGFPLMARRMELLEGNFRFNASFAVDKSETLLLAVEVADNGFMLR